MDNKQECLIKYLFKIFPLILIFLHSNSYALKPYISLKEAEGRALGTNYTLQAVTAQANAAEEQAGAKFAPLLPHWDIYGKFQYNTHVPTFSVPGFPQGFDVSVHTPYNFSTTVSYTVWDNLTNLNAYKSAQYFANSQQQYKENTKIELLLKTRLAYLLVQLSLQELKSVGNSLNVVRSQFKDIDNAYNAGAVAKLDWIDSQRNVLSYELQYEQQKANVELKVKDLYALLTLPTNVQVFTSEKISQDDIKLENELKINFDSLEESLERAKVWKVIPPPSTQPSLQTQLFLAQSYKAQADSTFGKLFPKIEAFATAQILYPDVIQLKTVNQNSFGATVSMPIFDGLNILHTVEANKQNEMMAHFNYNQIRVDLDRDYQKSIDLLRNLQIQKEININDIAAAQQSAALYYESFKAGKSLLINVQRANLQVLTSEVEGARITARMLEQLYQLQYLSGKLNL